MEVFYRTDERSFVNKDSLSGFYANDDDGRSGLVLAALFWHGEGGLLTILADQGDSRR